jgi:hypothetical protein
MRTRVSMVPPRPGLFVSRHGIAVVAAGWIAALLLGGVAHADDIAPRPKLVVENTEVDLGIREPGPRLEFVFQLKNTGTAPLQITDLKPSCGCLVPRCDREIPAGGSGSVTVTMESAALRGAIKKNLVVCSNDAERPEVALTVKALVRPSVELVPASNFLLPLRRGQSVERIVTVNSYEAPPAQILKIESSEPFLKAEVLPVETSSDDKQSPSQQQVRVTVLPEAPYAPFAATVTIETNNASHSRLVLNVNGYPEGAVSASPARIYFDQISAAPNPLAPAERFITLLKKDGSFKLLGIEADPALRVTTSSDSTGQFCEVILRYQGGWKPGPLKGTIVIKTTDPGMPRIEIPYTGQVVE